MKGSVRFDPQAAEKLERKDTELVENVNFSWRRPGQKVIPRRLAVAETLAIIDRQPKMSQLFLASEPELEEMRRQFPGLIVRWAEDEDKKEWALSPLLFADPRGMPTNEMVILPDEVQDRMKRNRRRAAK